MIRRKLTFILLLCAGFLLLLPGISALILAVAAMAGQVPGVEVSQAVLALLAALFAIVIGMLPLGAFFLRKSPRGSTLARISAWVFLILSLPFPLALAMPGAAAWLMLILSALALWTLTVGLDAETKSA